ncbi:MAG: mannose-1-phosphate guanylyltransferase/mannose-6-phosphate isomerase [Rhizobiaceae bacterium]|nr:mannose-1-phosphate guanylyltransferase/mannose-6-phosphate isomerase [Rhizobiaceae bacterium]
MTTPVTTRITPIIMVGGSGTRLWPVSRDSMPKQFVALLDDGFSTFQETLKRVRGPHFERPIVITNHNFRFLCAEQMQALGISGDIVLEPERRESAAAVAVGTILASRRAAEGVCLVLAADHAIADHEAFVADCRAAAESAADGMIMTLGVRPTHASTAYGYLAAGDEQLARGARRLQRFVEKPDRAKAEEYVEAGYLWNSGNFIFSIERMMAELQAFVPELLVAATEAVDGAVRDLDFIRLEPIAFARAPKVSIDYALMERTRHAGVIEATFDWSDIGAWDSVHDLKKKDGDGNVLEGLVSVIDTENSLVRSEDILTTVVGLQDVIVVTTNDAVLVASKREAGRVKDLVAKLQSEGRREAVEHLKMYRPWGWYQRIDIGPRFQVKHICVKPGGLLSLQRHHHRAEHWVVVHGTAEVTIDGAVSFYHENEAAYLPIGCTHRLYNPGRIDLKLIEVQVGSYTGEDDIVRIEDVYARA